MSKIYLMTNSGDTYYQYTIYNQQDLEFPLRENKIATILPVQTQSIMYNPHSNIHCIIYTYTNHSSTCI